MVRNNCGPKDSWILIGVVSWGRGCALAQYPGKETTFQVIFDNLWCFCNAFIMAIEPRVTIRLVNSNI